MAIWQYTFQILPKDSLDAIHDGYVLDRGEEGLDVEIFWGKRPVKRDLFNKVSFFLTKAKSWSDSIDLYGNQESNCFEVFFDEESYILSVSFRIDFRSDYEGLLNLILEFCIFNGLIILDEQLRIIPLNFEQVKSIIENSPQARKYNEFSDSP